ncbi:50S ribosomal protein L11 methyltransferase [Sphingomonas sp. G-3-2-10]|uniref:50S ribosomal protein L11 methyltransferase n=1 Tax=Sphingomonas sp. G-3-2-10 TaxID=2728838 RepID=UPI001469C2A6|nr:50S ribosomal protein L11 methyltransferase [Sphingomonas sp. G-3-2-10]NML06899.1 50S ribosomal protein L11 methyltransferase [Sphingomonas sp. G-3-2-10]
MSSWKVTLPCTRDEAEAIDFESAELLGLDPSPVLLTSETIPDDPASWQLEAYFDGKPNSGMIDAVHSLVPSSRGVKAQIEKLRDEDWVTMSQSGIEPVRAGRFYVHTANNKGKVPAGAKAFRIDAGLAFGTGTHETTAGCLMTLDALKRSGAQVRNLLDLGTGTGLLAFAAMHLWPRAHATASDIDPRSIEVTADNADINGVALGGGMGELALAAAPGMQHPLLIGRAPYDLIIANILAGPLIELAPHVAMALADRGTLIVAGLLKGQAEAVATAYRRQGLRLAGRIDNGDWPALRLVKRTRYGADRVTRGQGGPGEAPGFGSW